GHLIPRNGDWRQSEIALDIETEPLGDEFLALLPLAGYALGGAVALDVDLQGRPASGIEGTARAKGTRLSVQKRGSDKTVWRTDAGELSASLRVGQDLVEFGEIDLQAGDLSLSGDLVARQKTEGVLLEAAIDKAALPLATIHSGPFAEERRLRLDKASLVTLLADARLPGLKPGGTGEKMPPPGAIEVAANGSIAPHKARQENAASIPFQLDATISNLSAAEPHLDAQIETTLSETNLPELAAKIADKHLQVGGKTPVSLSMSGTPAEIGLDVEADLTGLSLKSRQVLDKKQGEAGRLSLRGQRRENGWDISAAALDLPPLNVTAAGQVLTGDDVAYDLSVKVAKLDLAAARKLSPVLAKIGLSGEVEGELALASSGRSGIFELYHIGLPVPGKLAELNHLSGTVRLDNKRLEAPQLQALLGESPVDLAVTVEDLSHPRFEIHLESPSMRANDLIFPNRQAFLRDLVADFVISGDGLHLVDVRTRLDGGTKARVEGTIAPFRAPDTMLAIDADYGNVDEVIGLFRGPKSEGESERSKQKAQVGEVLIDITAREGRFSSLEFSDAAGFLTIRNGQLSIHPLTFHADTGYFTGMVLRSGSGQSPHRLKISGHLENFDADTLYSEQLKHQGIITGKLRGDFYLEGNEGKEQFLKTSRGTFNLQIDGGVLRKFKVLAKIFSILNVSQLFKFQLPDTSSRGMPYDKLNASVRLRQGVLETEDLYIDSKAMNMTVVGTLSLLDKTLDLTIGVKPLQTVDKIISKIPIAGWLLTGEEKALITTHFEVRGTTADPKVRPIPISSVSDKAKGIFRRLFGLPGKIIEDVGDIFD
ncbi:MAG: hypothetical protein GWO11_00450, partial [Desulfuromonadales bacterium]|nr:hypothetical protein [Desulfuromonadales bacterium]NIR32996.1 hypothetical protein [Desulfuromonadales bacterium]NIS40545.1 hypothetical protein [Desulfuromonadales bacterium]